MRIKRIYNWRPGRKNMFAKMVPPPSRKTINSLTDSVDPIDTMIPIWDQGQLGSCTAHGIGRAWAHRLFIETGAMVMPSRLMIYYMERAMVGTIKQDAGAIIADGLTVLAKYGVCHEDLWPYVISKFKIKPPKKCYAAALAGVALEQAIVNPDIISIKTQLAAGNLIPFGFTVYESFESDVVANTGIVPMPKRGEQILGGHCTDMCGYDKQGVWCTNSWSDQWGKAGRFRLPWAFLTNCSDLHVLTKVK